MQRYVPAFARLLPVIFQVGTLCSIALTLPFRTNFTHVTFGTGEPENWQTNWKADPSNTVWLEVAVLSVVGTERITNENVTAFFYRGDEQNFFEQM